MYCQVLGVEYFVGKYVVQTILELVIVIVVFYSGVFYIIEIDEKKINRIRQVIIDGEIFLVVGIFFECDCKNDVNCDCYQSGDGYVKDVKFNVSFFLVVFLDGILYIVDLGNIRIRVVLKNKFLFNFVNFYEVVFLVD